MIYYLIYVTNSRTQTEYYKVVSQEQFWRDFFDAGGYYQHNTADHITAQFITEGTLNKCQLVRKVKECQN